jgi:hypothetical protein
MSVSVGSPPCSWNLTKFDVSPPPPPRGGRRFTAEIASIILDNLDSLGAPSLDKETSLPTIYDFSLSYYPQSNPLFDKALQRMRQGGALEKLRAQRDAAKELEEKRAEAQERLAAAKLRSLSLQEASTDKRSTRDPVTLGRQPPTRRKSSNALSA